MPESTSRQRAVTRFLVGVVLIGGIALLILLAPLSIRERKGDQQCLFRLRRLGVAVNQWVVDHGREQFPPIQNAAAGAAWQPTRPGSADKVLWEYLQGDVPLPQRKDEEDTDYYKRLRSQALTVCPLNDLPFWYNEYLHRLSPRALADGQPNEVWYFTVQRGKEADAPRLRIAGVTGRPTVAGYGEHSQISADDVEALREKVALEAAKNPNADEVRFWRRRLKRYETALQQAGGKVFTMSTLQARVYADTTTTK